ncbi:hypothetical protein ACOI22_03865 [Glaciecola sp. 2405UD65-10]|uniref:hypothetical protein n=1 Tax=Glaciecola sp. 2405UD65-10 TaxID=3397244 RepID=UPI003B59CBD4
MLYAIKTELNSFIKEHLEHAMLTKPRLDFGWPISQSVNIDGGVIISAGYDEYLPGSTLRAVIGRFEYDEENKEVRIYDGEKLAFKIVKADKIAYEAIMTYEGQYRPEDIARIKRHIKQMESAGRGDI